MCTFQVKEVLREDPRYIALPRENREKVFNDWVNSERLQKDRLEREARRKREEQVPSPLSVVFS